MGLYNQLVSLGRSSKNMRRNWKQKSLDIKFYKNNKTTLRQKRGWSLSSRFGDKSRSFK